MKANYSGEFFSEEDGNPLLKAIHELDKTQADFFQAAHDLVRIPSNKKLESFNESINANGSAFYEVVSKITLNDEIEKDEKSKQIATLLINTDKDRVEHFRKIAPQGQFARMPENRESLFDIVSGKFENNEDENTAISKIVSMYASHLNADTSRLIESIASGKKQKLYQHLEGVKQNAMQIGSISAGVAIGTIIASRVIKKLDS